MPEVIRGPEDRLAEGARSVLVEMLGSMRHTRDTPLHFGIDAPRIAAAALATSRSSLVDDAAFVEWALDRFVAEALGLCPGDSDRRSAPPSRRPLPRVLASWLERTHLALSAVHPLAVDILHLSLEREALREIAQRLGLGLRLTRRIRDEMRMAWSEREAL